MDSRFFTLLFYYLLLITFLPINNQETSLYSNFLSYNEQLFYYNKVISLIKLTSEQRFLNRGLILGLKSGSLGPRYRGILASRQGNANNHPHDGVCPGNKQKYNVSAPKGPFQRPIIQPRNRPQRNCANSPGSFVARKNLNFNGYVDRSGNSTGPRNLGPKSFVNFSCSSTSKSQPNLKGRTDYSVSSTSDGKFGPQSSENRPNYSSSLGIVGHCSICAKCNRETCPKFSYKCHRKCQK
ncbi:uncharacterized protein cubi_02132 [Cryptosporidium ubiquitum]|uniref:Uncharacterized protein n=1 Tax=Cryptosporidium ubiquitum TaxID=857276 RepID=A0A1J4M9M5_9CRYT|nr:uncharacterized protein cubi_02132 [Cryptosporidium ubiquitum]OII70921.1 hypothetical protein cubi_02132 [Cryptosporidium ubiquitum]